MMGKSVSCLLKAKTPALCLPLTEPWAFFFFWRAEKPLLPLSSTSSHLSPHLAKLLVQAPAQALTSVLVMSFHSI